MWSDGFSTPRRHHQVREADDVEHPPENIGQRCRAKLTANLLQTTHQERTLVHPIV
jgi:hypothetical protein